MEKVIDIKNLTKAFGKKTVIENLNLSVFEGEVLCIIGPSGSGKTTLLKCINQLIDISSGTVTIKNNIISSSNINFLRRKIGFVFQDFNLFSNLTVMKNITMAPVSLKIMTEDEAIERTKSILKRMNILEKIDAYPSQLSGGQKQRVAIARAMIMNPYIILFDEPTSALDPEMIYEVLTVIKELSKQKMTMIIVTHEIKFAHEIADRIVFMDGGKIIEEGTPHHIFFESKNTRVTNFLNIMR